MSNSSDNPARGRKSTPEFRAKWLAEFAKHRNVAKACEAMGCNRCHAYWLRQQFPEFATAWDEAWERVVDELEQSAMSRAIDGHEDIVYFQGKECGRRRVFDGRLTEFMLTMNRPSKYRSRDATPGLAPEDAAKAIVDAVKAMNASTGGAT